MKIIITFFSIAAVSLCIVYLIATADQNESDTTKKDINWSATGEGLTPGIPEIEKKEPPKQSKYYVKPETVPASFDTFYEMKQGERLHNVTRMMHNKELPKEVITFFKAEIFNRDNTDTTRNNMANAICGQRNPDPELHILFIKMLDDESEDPVWRDYCLQFLSACYKSSNNKPLIIETIKKYSKGNDSKAGTALIHLALNEQEIDSKQTLAQLEDPKTSIHTRTAILAVWGKTGETSQLPKIREYATQDKIASLKANAIGALGLMGEEADLVIINKALYHTNGRVVLAAKAAKKKIEERMKE